MDADQLEGIYGTLPRTLNDFDLQKDQIDLKDALGLCLAMSLLKN